MMIKKEKTKVSTISCRVTNEEKEEIQKRAKEAGMSITEYVKSCMEKNPVVVLAEGKAIAREFIKLCNVIENNNLEEIHQEGERICHCFVTLMEKISA